VETEVEERRDVHGPLEDGSALVCKKDVCRVVKAPVGVRAHIEMERTRKLLAEMQESGTLDSGLGKAFQSRETLTESWNDVRQIYCREFPGGGFIDLAGNKRTCR
jgi:hypothetical protein